MPPIDYSHKYLSYVTATRGQEFMVANDLRRPEPSADEPEEVGLLWACWGFAVGLLCGRIWVCCGGPSVGRSRCILGERAPPAPKQYPPAHPAPLPPPTQNEASAAPVSFTPPPCCRPT